MNHLDSSIGAALFSNNFIPLGFLRAWKEVVPDRDRARVFQALDAAWPGKVNLTVPCVYLAARA